MSCEVVTAVVHYFLLIDSRNCTGNGFDLSNSRAYPSFSLTSRPQFNPHIAIYSDLSGFENSVDPDQLASEKPADQDPHCFPLCL